LNVIVSIINLLSTYWKRLRTRERSKNLYGFMVHLQALLSTDKSFPVDPEMAFIN